MSSLSPELAAPRGQLDEDQITQLLERIAPHRVVDDGRGHAALAGQDVKAHLIRVFGFGGFDYTPQTRLLYCEPHLRDGVETGRFVAAYWARVTLVIRNRKGLLVSVITEENIAESDDEPTRGKAHKMALTSAITLALKRAAVALGDQFGLGLYNGGSLRPLVCNTLERWTHSREATEREDGAEGAGEAEDLQSVLPIQITDDMTGADPDNAAELGRMRAYQAAARPPAEDQSPVSADPDQQRAWLLAEVRFLDQLVPGLAAKIATRLQVVGEEGLREVRLAELLAVVAAMRTLAAGPLRISGHHDAADRYQAADPRTGAPVTELLGCDPLIVLPQPS